MNLHSLAQSPVLSIGSSCGFPVGWQPTPHGLPELSILNFKRRLTLFEKLLPPKVGRENFDIKKILNKARQFTMICISFSRYSYWKVNQWEKKYPPIKIINHLLARNSGPGSQVRLYSIKFQDLRNTTT